MMFSYHNNNREFDILELPSVDSFDKMSGDSKINIKCFFDVHTCVTHPLFKEKLCHLAHFVPLSPPKYKDVQFPITNKRKHLPVQFTIWKYALLLPESRPGIHASKPSRQINFQAVE